MQEVSASLPPLALYYLGQRAAQPQTASGASVTAQATNVQLLGVHLDPLIDAVRALGQRPVYYKTRTLARFFTFIFFLFFRHLNSSLLISF